MTINLCNMSSEYVLAVVKSDVDVVVLKTPFCVRCAMRKVEYLGHSYPLDKNDVHIWTKRFGIPAYAIKCECKISSYK